MANAARNHGANLVCDTGRAMSGHERRKSERKPVTAKVTMRGSNQEIELEIDNISAGGLFLKLPPTQRPMSVLGEAVVVAFDVGPDSYGDPLDLEVDAEVVRIDLGGPGRPAGIALMFTSTDPAVPQRLALVLEFLRDR
jgi:hypothetical protein